jgi:flagellar basal-body rod protein FlgB
MVEGETPMFEKLSVFKVAGNAMSHASRRQVEIARNVANADTPGYRANDLPAFRANESGSSAFQLTRSRPEHLGVNGRDPFNHSLVDTPDSESPNGNTVSLEAQALKAVETTQMHEMALGIYRSSLNIIRASIGRG